MDKIIVKNIRVEIQHNMYFTLQIGILKLHKTASPATFVNRFALKSLLYRML